MRLLKTSRKNEYQHFNTIGDGPQQQDGNGKNLLKWMVWGIPVLGTPYILARLSPLGWPKLLDSRSPKHGQS